MVEPKVPEQKAAKSSGRKPTRARQLGVTDDEYARLLAAQDGHCALCPATPKTRRLHTDHEHRSERVRGLLCHRCNRALPTWITREWLERAADYIDPPRRSAEVAARKWASLGADHGEAL